MNTQSELQERANLWSGLLNNLEFTNSVSTIGELIAEEFRAGRLILVCGNGGSAAEAQHFTGELVGRFITERRGLPAISLSSDTSSMTAISNDYGYEQVFARQVEAYSSNSRLLIALSTSGNSRNLVAAVGKAREVGMTSVGILGGGGGLLASKCDHSIVVPADKTAVIQEVHLAIIHLVCAIVDEDIYG